MCGRFSLAIKKEVLSEYFDAQVQLEFEPLLHQYNIAPSENILAIIQDEQQQHRQLVAFHWGLIPYWVKEGKNNRLKCINARVETVQTSKLFKHSFKHKRCIIPATSFFEWQNKQPYLIAAQDKHPLAFAGLWSHWQSANKSIDSCCIITTDAIGESAKIHQRMPVILGEEIFETWLNREIHELTLPQVIQGMSYLELISCPVTKKMNNGRYKNADAIKCI